MKTFRLTAILAALLSCTFSSFAQSKANEYLITKYGAKANSTKLQTKQIQKAIDAAYRHGGGTVVIPAGEFRSGALFFKKGTHLRLEEGAVLGGSDDIKDYPICKVHIEGVIQDYFAALVNAYGVDGFSIEGKGTIDGNGQKFWEAFWARRKENPKCTNLEVSRPRMIYICNSKNIEIKDVFLLNSGFWHTHLYKCDSVLVDGVKIRAPHKPVKAPSSDGIDLDACRNVHIIRCDISVADDIISLKGGKGPWADTDPDNGTNENILVEDCSFFRGPGVLVFGSECVGAKNVVMRNCKVNGPERLVWLKMRPDTPQRYEDILVENITGKVDKMLYVKPWTQFFDLKGCKEIPMSYANNVTIRGCHLKCKKAIDVKEDTTQYILTNFDVDDNYIAPNLKVNYDVDKIGTPVLEDPLTFVDGTKVTKENWQARRAEIQEIFQANMFGRMPETCPIYTEDIAPEYVDARFDGRVRTRAMWFKADKSGPCVKWTTVYPLDASAEKKYPVIMMLNYYGNDKILANEGNDHSVFPMKQILDSGFAYITACYEDISPDPDYPREQDEIAYTGVFDLWGGKALREKDDATGALMAWAWTLCRGCDMISNDERIDADKIVITGSSRLGKAAMLASAFDERFKVTIVNQAGGGGITLSKRNYGESVTTENAYFTHWWCPKYKSFVGKEATMPFDQHLIVSCIAPRAFMVEGFNNKWFDTEGEFESLKAASCAWELFGSPGLPKVSFPDNDSPAAIGHDLAYLRRDGQHGFYPTDWLHLLNFATTYLK